MLSVGEDTMVYIWRIINSPSTQIEPANSKELRDKMICGAQFAQMTTGTKIVCSSYDWDVLDIVE